MIELTLAEVAEVVGGRVVGAGADAGDGADAGNGGAVGEEVRLTGPVVIDSRLARPGSLFAAFVGEHVDGHDHTAQAAAQGAVAVLGTRPTELPTLVVDDPREALQRLAAAVVARVRDEGLLTVLAVTGSQGKTSTKDLLCEVLGAAGATVATPGSFNNELGMPLSALQVEPDTHYLVLEMGARGRGHLSELTDLVPPDVSVVLNVGTAHLGEFGSREAIAEAKGELVAGLRPGGVAVLNADDDRVLAMAALGPGRVLTFGGSEEADVRLDGLRLDRLGRPGFDLVAGGASAHVDMQLVGAHQAMNAAAAATAALAVGVSLPEAATALAHTDSLSHWRMELHERPDGVLVLNDAYNANPESMRAALDALATIGADAAVRRTVAVLGEMRELGAERDALHRQVGRHAAERVDQVLVVGEAARGIAEGVLGAVGARTPCELVADNAAALAWLRARLGPGDAVLLKASRGACLDEVAAELLAEQEQGTGSRA